MKPLLFCDVDGVINAFSHDYHKDDRDAEGWVTYDQWVESASYKFSISYSTEIVERMAALNVEWVWATTWIEDPPALCELAAITGLPVDAPMISHIARTFSGYTRGSGKAPAVEQYLEACQDRDIIWLDDELGESDKDVAQAHYGNTLLMNPTPSLGLTHAQLDEIEAWIENSINGVVNSPNP